MSGPNPLSFNSYISQVAAMAVYQTQQNAGVTSFLDAPPSLITPVMLNYSERRIERDIDMLASRSSNQYTLTAGVNILPIPVGDFRTVETMQIAQVNGAQVVNTSPMTPVSREYIQNCYGGLQGAGIPRYFAMVGDNFGDGADTLNNVLLGPYPNAPYTVIVNGTIWQPSLYSYASNGVADTQYTYISNYYSEMLLMASMIYISAFQRNFSATSDSPDMGQSYEKQYQVLRLGAIEEENRKKQLGSAFSAYSTPVSATPTR